ncbi:MAG: hypothetical protein H8E44_21165 [Planctomycetes bacterium]|nr:hypothetical protein [Planctomycetota bacterium]MBL7037702.1 hypothetical protein [Pirellulaceae bacterium]
MPKCPFCDHRNPASAELCGKCGGPLPTAPQTNGRSLEEQLLWLLDRDEKPDAISLYRQQTGAGQQDASDALDAFERGEPLPPLPEVEAGLEEEILTLLQGGKKIQAVRVYREQTGSDLKDALRAIDALAAKHGIAAKGAGCAGAVLMILTTVWIAARFLVQV